MNKKKILCIECVASSVCINSLINGSGILYNGTSCKKVQKLKCKKCGNKLKI